MSDYLVSTIWHKILPDLGKALQFIAGNDSVFVGIAAWVLEFEDVEDSID